MPTLNPSVTYDRAFHVAAVADAVYFGSSADDKVTCLDASTGEARWSFYTGGPVRLCPTVHKGKVYVGSDDGFVYCLRAADGGLVWRYRPCDENRQIPGNGRLVSVRPVRTGLVIQDDVVYFCSGLFPTEGVSVCALSATDGTVVWKTDPSGLSPQGYLLASRSCLYVPTGRTPPVVLDRRDGKQVGVVKADRGEGGTYALLADEHLIHGPGENGRLAVAGAGRGDRIASFSGIRLIAGPRTSYLQTTMQLMAFDRVRYLDLRKQREAMAAKQGNILKKIGKLGRYAGGKEGKALREELADARAALKKLLEEGPDCFGWKQSCRHRYSLILAGDVLFAGGDGEVAAFRASDGKRVWAREISGRACGLSVSNGRLYVSSDTGTIHCFGRTAAKVRTVGPADVQVPYPTGERTSVCASTADHLVAQTGIDRGYCLVLGCGEGRLAYEIAKRTKLHVVGIEPNEAKVLAARKALDRAGLYGRRVTVHRGGLTELPYADYTMNLVVSDATETGSSLPTPAAEVFRVLRPCGGAAWIGLPAQAMRLDSGAKRSALKRWMGQAAASAWKQVEQNGLWAACRRGPLPGSGEWTQMYGAASNTACSGDQRLTGPMRIQWFGRPGPREMIDRHHRNVPPLVRDGRVFIPGDNRIFAVDAYNGAALWDLDVPNSRRLGAPFDGGSMAVAEDRLYVAAEDKCLNLDVATGRQVTAFPVLQLIDGQTRHWGYVGIVGDLLLGSGRKAEAIYTRISRSADAYQWGDYKRMVTSDSLFCLDRTSGKKRWTYRSGVIINPSIAAGGGRVYFVESHSREAAEDRDGQIAMNVLIKDGMALVALDAKTGQVVWKQTPDLKAFRQIVYLIHADDMLIAFGARNQGRQLWHDLIGFDARTGKVRWRQTRDTRWRRGGTHGEQVRHPVIVDKTIYAEAHAYDLYTGKPVPDWTFNHDRTGCGTVTASSSCLFYRDRNPAMLNLADRKQTRLSRVNRPGCWVNIIPAGGLVLVPEGSSGCTCAYPIQTSMAFAPRAPREIGASSQ